MLLPSALPCEPFLPSSQHMHQASNSPRLMQPSHSATSSLLASCRVLQSILGNAPALSCQNNKQCSALRRRTESLRVPLQPCVQNATAQKNSPLTLAPPGGLKKRRREEYEAESDDEMNNIHSAEPENNPTSFSTPKRQRRAPLAMPLGLSAADFQSLQSSNTEPVELDMPDPPSFEINVDADAQANNGDAWTTADDRALVEIVLEKLRLSRHGWNDCARILGKDKDSLGKRWKMLVGEGDVGLRRGGKRPGRTDLDIRSW